METIRVEFLQLIVILDGIPGGVSRVVETGALFTDTVVVIDVIDEIHRTRGSAPAHHRRIEAGVGWITWPYQLLGARAQPCRQRVLLEQAVAAAVILGVDDGQVAGVVESQ